MIIKKFSSQCIRDFLLLFFFFMKAILLLLFLLELELLCEFILVFFFYYMSLSLLQLFGSFLLLLLLKLITITKPLLFVDLIIEKNKVSTGNSVNNINSNWSVYIGGYDDDWGLRMKKFGKILLFIWSGNNWIAYTLELWELSLEGGVLLYTGFLVIISIIYFLFLIIIIIYLLLNLE